MSLEEPRTKRARLLDEKTQEPPQQLRDELNLGRLDRDVLAKILSFLCWRKILRARLCRALKDASLITLITEQVVVRRKAFGDKLGKLAAILPRIEDITIATAVAPGILSAEDASRGEDEFDINFIDIDPLQQLKYLKVLRCPHNSRLFGSYPVLFSLKSLQSLTIPYNENFRCDLADFATLSNLSKIHLVDCPLVTGELRSLRHLKQTLQTLFLVDTVCSGSLSDLSDFSALTKLSLEGNKEITGDIRQIAPSHLPSLEHLNFTGTSIFGTKYEPATIDEVREFYVAWNEFMKQPRPFPRKNSIWLCKETARLDLHSESSDRYEQTIPWYEITRRTCVNKKPPFSTEMVMAGPRVGYRWRNKSGMACDVIWLDPEPKPGDEKFDEYQKDFAELEEKHRGSFYRGLTRPPSEDEWRRMVGW